MRTQHDYYETYRHTADVAGVPDFVSDDAYDLDKFPTRGGRGGFIENYLAGNVEIHLHGSLAADGLRVVQYLCAVLQDATADDEARKDKIRLYRGDKVPCRFWHSVQHLDPRRTLTASVEVGDEDGLPGRALQSGPHGRRWLGDYEAADAIAALDLRFETQAEGKRLTVRTDLFPEGFELVIRPRQRLRETVRTLDGREQGVLL
jgi:hypothetical protein